MKICMKIDAMHAKTILEAIGYSCDALEHVTEVPEPAVEALHSAWESAQQQDLEQWEVELITTRMLHALMPNAKQDF